MVIPNIDDTDMNHIHGDLPHAPEVVYHDHHEQRCHGHWQSAHLLMQVNENSVGGL
jgi:hypothetical protein